MKDKAVKLDKNTALELVCRIFQAEQALSGLSEFHWTGLIRYYDQRKVHEMRSIIERVRQFLPPDQTMIATAQPPAYLHPDYRFGWCRQALLAIGGPFLVYCWPFFNRLRSHWSFPSQELAYMLNRLEAFLELLGLPAYPGHSPKVALRINLCDCRWIIEGRCDGLRELKKVGLVEYFNKSPYVETIPLSAIINPAARAAA